MSSIKCVVLAARRLAKSEEGLRCGGDGDASSQLSGWEHGGSMGMGSTKEFDDYGLGQGVTSFVESAADNVVQGLDRTAAAQLAQLSAGQAQLNRALAVQASESVKQMRWMASRRRRLVGKRLNLVLISRHEAPAI
jgi:hypothetical protein